ncbi:MAG: universal stress protein [Desulfobacterales bacterium]|nr:universal stress protein [Desulfobacterales bacterium]
MSWLQKKCVVVPVDFSEDSFRAVRVAEEFVEKDADLHVIHVTQPWSEHEIGGSWGQETEEERLRSIEKAIQEKLQAMDHEDVRIAIHMGSPPVEIIRYAEQVGAELIVMPSVGKTGLKHFALGSVAERVVRRAHCPVLVLRKEEQKKGKSKKIIDYD